MVDSNFVLKDTLSSIPNLNSFKVLIFGGTGGLGRAIARLLAVSGVQVTVVGRTFRDDKVNNIKFLQADLTSMTESAKFAKSIDVSETNVVLFTTGIFAARQKQVTEEGLEKDIAVSYLNRLVILDNISPKLSTHLDFKPRVFFMGFPGNNQLGSPDDLNQEKSYSFFKQHMNTVAGNESLVNYGKVNFPNANFYGLNPGMVKTNIRDNLLGQGWFSSAIESVVGWFTPTAEQYAEKISPVLLTSSISDRNGLLFDKNGTQMKPSKGLDQQYALNFVSRSKDLLKSKGINW